MKALFLFLITANILLGAPQLLSEVSFSGQTTDATEKVIYTETVAADGDLLDVVIVCKAKMSDSSKRENFRLEATVYRISGSAGIEGNVSSVHDQGSGAYDLNMDTSGTTFRVLAKGTISETVNFNCKRYLE